MRPDTLRGHLDALIPAVLERQARHGYAVIEALQEHSGGALDLPTGTVYPALRRLERAGYVKSEWSTVGGRQRPERSRRRQAPSGRHADGDQRHVGPGKIPL